MGNTAAVSVDYAKLLQITRLRDHRRWDPDPRHAGGEERTLEEYEALLAKASFKFTRVVPTESVVSIIEAVKA
jgi:hypothetical protein